MDSKPTLRLSRDNQCSELLSLYAWEFAPMVEPRRVSWQRVAKLPPREPNVELGESIGE